MSEVRDASITIIGGGAIGCAVAYFLAKAGHRDIQVLEASELCAQTSSQAAGLVGQVRLSPERTRLAMRSVAFFSKLEELTGVSPDWLQCGSLRISLTPERTSEHLVMADVAKNCGLEVRFLKSSELKEMFPTIELAKVHSALWCPTDGYLQPNSLVNAYAAGARSLGVTFATNSVVTAISTVQNKIASISTKLGDFSTSMVINAAGPWAGAVAQMVGLKLPIVPVRHEYYISEQALGWHRNLPVLRIPDLRIYARAEGSAVLCGGWEARAKSLDPRTVNATSALHVEPDFDVLAGFHESIASIVEGLDDIGVKSVFKGYPAFSPDGKFIVGPVKAIAGFVMAAGCNAHGVSGSAGLAEHVLESIGPNPSTYVQSLSPQRYLESSWDYPNARKLAQSAYENYYALGASAQGGSSGVKS